LQHADRLPEFTVQFGVPQQDDVVCEKVTFATVARPPPPARHNFVEPDSSGRRPIGV